MKIICDVEVFESATDMLVAIKKMSQRGRERMLMDLAWKMWEKQSDLLVQAYRPSVLV